MTSLKLTPLKAGHKAIDFFHSASRLHYTTLNANKIPCCSYCGHCSGILKAYISLDAGPVQLSIYFFNGSMASRIVPTGPLIDQTWAGSTGQNSSVNGQRKAHHHHLSAMELLKNLLENLKGTLPRTV